MSTRPASDARAERGAARPLLPAADAAGVDLGRGRGGLADRRRSATSGPDGVSATAGAAARHRARTRPTPIRTPRGRAGSARAAAGAHVALEGRAPQGQREVGIGAADRAAAPATAHRTPRRPSSRGCVSASAMDGAPCVARARSARDARGSAGSGAGAGANAAAAAARARGAVSRAAHRQRRPGGRQRRAIVDAGRREQGQVEGVGLGRARGRALLDGGPGLGPRRRLGPVESCRARPGPRRTASRSSAGVTSVVAASDRS